MKKLVMIIAMSVMLAGQGNYAQVNMVFTAESDSVIRSMCAQVSKDSIQLYMTHLQDFGTRFYRATGYRNVAQWIRNKLADVGCQEAVLDSFWYTNTAFTGWQYNVIATIPGVQKPDSIYIVGAHHDCTSDNRLVDAPGADDNASGVAAAIEIARVMNQSGYRPRSTVKFMTFVAEEMGLYGSEDVAVTAKNSNMRIQMMLNNDMISYCADTVNQWKVKLTYYNNSADVTNLADTCTKRFTTLGTTRTTQYNDASDSYSFYAQGFKTIFFIENYDTPYYHTTQDRVETCNMKFAAEMTRISLAMLVSQNGTETMIGTGETEPVASGFRLDPNYPNPFNPSTTIRYQTALSGTVSLKIYNMLGQEVRTLVNAAQTAGEHTVQWDGKDHAGKAVSSGIYIYRLQAGNFAKSNKMTLMR